MVRFLVPLLICLVLSACFESARFEIPVVDKAQPAGLEGRFWNLADAPSKLGIEEFVFTSDGDVTWTRKDVDADADDDENSWPTRLISLTDSGSYLFIIDADDDVFQYMILESQTNGAWVMIDPSVDNEWPFGESNEIYAQAIAARHGITINAGEVVGIQGTINSENIFGMFRDPEFLGALNMEVFGLFLPTQSTQQRPEEFDADLGSSRSVFLGLSGNGAALPGASLPEGLSGAYAYSSAFEMVDLQFVQIKALRDETYEVRRGQDELYHFQFLPSEEGKDPKIGLKIKKYASPEGNTSLDISFIYVERNLSGWSMWPIKVRVRPTLPTLEDMQIAVMKQAAKRHGLDFDGWSIIGARDAAQLSDLFDDGQFTSGLIVDHDQGSEFFTDESVRKGLEDAVYLTGAQSQ